MADKVSIILLNYNGGDHTATCLESLAELDYPARELEIIVVDNASTDGSADAIGESFPDVKLIRSPENVGFSRGANLGASHASGGYLAFLNNDMKVDPGWLGPLVEAMTDPSVGCAGSVIRSWDGTTVEFGGRRADAFAIAYSAATDAPPSEDVVGGAQLFVSGGAMLVRASLFHEVGGFDPGYFMYQEDIDLCWRLWLSGSSCVLVPESEVRHRGGASSSRLSPQFVQGMSQANVLATLFKNLEDRAVRSSLPLVIVYLLMRSADQAGGLEGFDRAMKIFRSAVPELVEKRKSIQTARLRGDSEIWELAGYPLSFLEGTGSFQRLMAAMMGDTMPEYSLENAEELQNLVGLWAERASDLIGVSGEVFAIERARRDRMRQLEIAARDSVIGQRDEGIIYLQQMLKSSETELTVLRDQVELLSDRTRDYDSYVRLAELIAAVADEFGVPGLAYEPSGADSSAGQATLAEAIPGGSRYDIVCFSIIDWEFRWQRPQQLMSQFADHGHRVFYISIARIVPVAGERFRAVKLRENVWEIQLALPTRVDVYGGDLSRELAMLVTEDLRALRGAYRISEAVSVIQVATWAAVAYRTKESFGWPVVYDCMDEWDTFPGMANALLTAERRLIGEADLVVVTAKKLFEKYRNANAHVLLARNAADFERFHRAEPGAALDDMPRPIVGYFGAIADWFDLDLMVRIARERPKYSFVLIGGVFGLDMRDLEDLANVYILGQQPYEMMPSYLRGFDACIIPFKVNAVTEATDPVKFYEFISQGKPVVSTTMPELYPYAELLYIARDPEDFLGKLDQALRENDDILVERRIELARANAWPARYEAIRSAIAAVVPKVSIVIVTFHNLDFTRQCIDSVLANTLYPDLEIIVVDNASTDGTREYLQELEQQRGIRVILNDENAGFARANNQGLRVARGEYLVLLNNDTVVPRGWLNGLLRHLRDPEIGLVNSVTNFSGNESRIEVPYTDVDGMGDFAAGYMAAHFGEIFDIRVAAMYCVAMRREVYERVGPLDETFGIGMFEDDDYSHRMRLASYRVVCAEDSFVHHFGQASFKKLDPETYQQIWDANQTHFQTKWNMPWQAHTARRPDRNRSTLPDRAAVEILFAKLARRRELADAQAEKATEVAELHTRLDASKERIDMLEHLLYVTRNELHSIQELRVLKLAGVYWRARSFLRGRRPDGTPALTPDSFAPEVAPTTEPVVDTVVEVAAAPVPVAVMPQTVTEESAAPVARIDTERPVVYDVICFPIIDWDFRMQRPQQMMLQFSAAGHRVFYVSHQIRLKGEACEVRKVAEKIFEVSLRGSPRDVYVQSMTQKDAEALEEGLRILRTRYGICEAVTIVQLPFWTPLVLSLRDEYGWSVTYDMMDNMAAFSTSPKSILEVEEQLLNSSDLVVVTSMSLEHQAQGKNSNVALIRNGVDYEHFARVSTASPFHTARGRPLIGYYGAIAEWFDVDLVAELARRHPEWDFVLIGSTVSSNVKRLRKLRNLSLAGERPYADLPMWLERFDVAIIPFRMIPLTEATNPVKAYEMLAAGKPVVSVPMPEVAAMAPLVRLASTVEDFETQISQAIEFDYEPWIVEKRRAFARQNTWQRRWESLDQRIRETFEKVLIVMDVPERERSVLKHLTEMLDLTLWPNVEVVVLTKEVFLARSEELASRLRELKKNVRLESLSRETFSEASNRLFTSSDGDYLVVLPFGAELHEGWLYRLIRHLSRDEEIGVIVPEIVDKDSGRNDLADRIDSNDGKVVDDGDGSSLVALRRETFDRIGPLGKEFRTARAAARGCVSLARTSSLRVVRASDVLVKLNAEGRDPQSEKTL